MKKTTRARLYTSPIIEEILNSIPPIEKEKTKNRMIIAARIDDYMMLAGLSKMELSRRLNKRPSEVTRWLSGTHNFTTDTLTEIACELKVTIADLHRSKEELIKKRVETTYQIIENSPVKNPITPWYNPVTMPGFTMAKEPTVPYGKQKQLFA
jgi:transcriptional regulator with XRE-family HTH domain